MSLFLLFIVFYEKQSSYGIHFFHNPLYNIQFAKQNASVLARQLNVNVLHHKIMWNWIVGVLLLSAATHFLKSIRAYFSSVAKLKRLNNQVSEINKRRKGTLQWLKSNIKVNENEVESIINLNLSDLLVHLKTNQVTSEKVLKVYTWKAIEATEATNCVTDFLYVEALSRARQLDQLSDEEKGPLHGLPFSVKEHFFIKDQEVTVGLYSRLGQKPDKNAALGMYHTFLNAQFLTFFILYA